MPNKITKAIEQNVELVKKLFPDFSDILSDNKRSIFVKFQDYKNNFIEASIHFIFDSGKFQCEYTSLPGVPTPIKSIIIAGNSVNFLTQQFIKSCISWQKFGQYSKRP